jgi:hypothetical protein
MERPTTFETRNAVIKIRVSSLRAVGLTANGFDIMPIQSICCAKIPVGRFEWILIGDGIEIEGRHRQ